MIDEVLLRCRIREARTISCCETIQSRKMLVIKGIPLRSIPTQIQTKCNQKLLLPLMDSLAIYCQYQIDFSQKSINTEIAQVFYMVPCNLAYILSVCACISVQAKYLCQFQVDIYHFIA